MEDVEHYGIPVYNFPYDIEEDDEETITDNSELRVSANLSQSSNIQLTVLSDVGTATLCHCRQRRRDRHWRRRDHPSPPLPLGNSRSRQPSTQRFCPTPFGTLKLALD